MQAGQAYAADAPERHCRLGIGMEKQVAVRRARNADFSSCAMRTTNLKRREERLQFCQVSQNFAAGCECQKRHRMATHGEPLESRAKMNWNPCAIAIEISYIRMMSKYLHLNLFASREDGIKTWNLVFAEMHDQPCSAQAHI